MERLAINRGSLVTDDERLTVTSFKEVDGTLEITVPNKTAYLYKVNDSIYLKRTIQCSGYTDVLEQRMQVCGVTKEVSYTRVATTLPEKTLMVASSLTQYETDYNLDYTTTSRDNDKVTTVVTFLDNHRIYAQDIVDNGGSIPIHVYDDAWNELGTVYAVGVPKMFSKDAVEKADTYSYESQEACGKSYDYYVTSAYTFLPDNFSRNALIISGLTATIQNEAVYYVSEFNEFYRKIGTKYAFWGDSWTNEDTDITGRKTIGFYRKTNFWNVPISLSSNESYGQLESEDHFGSSLVDDVVYASMPDIIDMERVKYEPSIKNGSDYEMVTGITIIPHFRARCRITSANTDSTKDYNYADGWYLGDDEKENGWWNGYASGNTSSFNVDEVESRIISSLYTPDLLGWLNFTDNDVYYRKSVIKKSFFRLYFFDSKDPISGKLLFSSTVALDSGELYGKFIKKKNNLIKINRYTEGAATVISYSGGTDTVSSEVTITGDYDTTKCAEGFNLYLFSDDVPTGNTSRTIYMKVEFFHAGNGKTVPLIIWPSNENGALVPLTNNNQIDSLYIPVEICYYNNRYVYSIPSAINTISDKTIRLSLYEPRITQEDATS